MLSPATVAALLGLVDRERRAASRRYEGLHRAADTAHREGFPRYARRLREDAERANRERVKWEAIEAELEDAT